MRSSRHVKTVLASFVVNFRKLQQLRKEIVLRVSMGVS
jgi:hypothetical protein